MKATIKPQDFVFWSMRDVLQPSLKGPLTVDVVVVGGGMAGISAAQSFAQQGASVALLEKTYCGAGATGKSSGFIIPNTEFSLGDLIRFYGPKDAGVLWKLVTDGVEHIRSTIKTHNLGCDYTQQDAFLVATSERSVSSILKPDQAAYDELSYKSTLLSPDELFEYIQSSTYYGGIRYENTFGINGYRYCQELKKVLIKQGVQIYEETPVTELTEHGVKTTEGEVKAQHVVVCLDRFVTDLGKLKHDIFHVQTFLTLTEPLSDSQIHAIFPKGPCMVWDTNTIYNYYRLTADNRLMVGGAELLSTYAYKEKHNNYRQAANLHAYIKRTFPQLSVEFSYIWPGMLGISKDVMPIASQDKHMPNVFYVGAATGLSWAAALGRYSATRVLKRDDDVERLLSYERFSRLSRIASMIFGDPLTFALNNLRRVGTL